MFEEVHEAGGWTGSPTEAAQVFCPLEDAVEEPLEVAMVAAAVAPEKARGTGGFLSIYAGA